MFLYRKFASGVQKYIKAVYTEYTDSTFTTVKPKPPWAGEYHFPQKYLYIQHPSEDTFV